MSDWGPDDFECDTDKDVLTRRAEFLSGRKDFYFLPGEPEAIVEEMRRRGLQDPTNIRTAVDHYGRKRLTLIPGQGYRSVPPLKVVFDIQKEHVSC